MKLVRTIFLDIPSLEPLCGIQQVLEYNMIEYIFEVILVEKILRGGSADVLDEICES